MTMKYNIYIETMTNTRSLLDISESIVKKIITAYKENKEFIFINGEKFFTYELREMQVYEFNNSHFSTGQDLFEYCKENNHLERGYFSDPYVPKKVLKQLSNEVTESFINDDELEEIETTENTNDYVDKKRLLQLEKINNQDYDLSKLIAILKELNVCNKHNLKFAIPPLVRMVIDHIPPFFGKSNFSDVCGSYGSKSFKESMTILDKNTRKIADSYLHTQIRKRESALPTETQINFKSELDVLLQEIVRIS